MKKRFLPILLVLSLLLCGAVSPGKPLSSLSTEKINELQELAGENGAQWTEGTPPSSDMNAFQMWQWTDWFLSNRVRSLLGTLRDYEQLEPGVPLNSEAEGHQWQLRETENILSRFEAQLENDRLTIIGGIRQYQSDGTSDAERLTVCKRILEAESEIRQIIETICEDYDTYLASVDNCYRGLQASYGGYTLDVHDNTFNSLLQSAEALENSENAAASDFSVSVISTYQLRIRVCAPDQKPIENATVTVTSRLNGTQKQAATDAQGNVIFWVGDLGADENGELMLNLRIEAEGYRTREMQTVSFRRDETRSFDLQKDDGTPYLIMGSFNGQDILTESNSCYCSQENTAKHTFAVKLHCDTDGELELRYSVDAEATEYRTVVKTFSATDSDNTVLEFEDQWLNKLIPGAKVSFTIKADGKPYTTDTLLIVQKGTAEKPTLNTQLQTLPEGEINPSYNPVTALTNEKNILFDNTGAEPPRLSETSDISYGSNGLEPNETQQLFSQLDIATGECRYMEIGGQTYLFWLQPGSSNLTARLWWYNLNDSSKYGEVSCLDIEGQQEQRQLFTDYAFAAESVGDFCALTILSGQFSGDEPVTPSNACVATVLMKQSETKGLDMIGYQEGAVFDQSGNYPIMPEVRLLENNGEVSVLSTYSTAGNPEKIDSQLYDYSPEYSDNTESKLQKIQSQTCVDEAKIVQYRIATTAASGQQAALYTLNAEGELSLLTTDNRDVLAQGDIISFRVLTDAESGTTADRLFYLEQVRTEEGGTIQRLKSVTPDGKQKTDYDIETGTTLFDIVRYGGGVYLYWTECSTSDVSSGTEEEYLVRCVRYDTDTDTASGPFSLVEFNESPCSVNLKSSGTGFYAVDLHTSAGSYRRVSLSRIHYGFISSAEMKAAELSDPCVSAGDYTELVLSVNNTGNVPLSAFDVEIVDTETDALVQTLHIDLDNPELSTNTYCFHGETYTITGTNVLRRVSGMYDPLNHDSWIITTSTAADSTERSVRTDLLMPGHTHSYQTKMQIPADWKGGKTFVARIVSVTGESALGSIQTEEELLLIGAPQPVSTAQSALTERLGSEAVKEIDTDAHDLMLSAQLFRRSGEDYVHITVRNRSGNKYSDITPILTASHNDETLYSHTFRNPLGDDFGYSMDIPLQTLLNGRALPELDLHVGNADYEDFEESDNDVHLLLSVQLCLVEQPASVTAIEGKNAIFSVAAAGGEKPYSYRWQSMTGTDQWTDIPGADKDTYRIASVQLEQNGLTVRCVITDQLGYSVTSDSAVLSVLPQLSIVGQPVSITATEGENAMFSVTVDGGEKPYSYRWQGLTGTDQWTDIPGADKDTYRIASVQLEQNGLTVRCVITDQFGDSVTSDSAALSVRAKQAANSDTETPQTGDNSHMALWIALLAASVSGLAGTAVYSKRKRAK